MGDHQQRSCLNRAMSLSAETENCDHRMVADEVDRMLACNGRHACATQLACSWLAAELASALARRYR